MNACIQTPGRNPRRIRNDARNAKPAGRCETMLTIGKLTRRASV